MYELKSTMQVDKAANMIVQLVTDRPHFVHFDEGALVCHHCGNHLGVYYCENRTYAVRCLGCETITLVKSGNPGGALQRVGVKKNGGAD